VNLSRRVVARFKEAVMAVVRWGTSTVKLDPDGAATATGLVSHGRHVAASFGHCHRVATRVSGLTWTVHELAAHLAATTESYAKIAVGEELTQHPLAERQQVIDEAIAKLRAVDTRQLAEMITVHAEALATTLSSGDSDEFVRYYGVSTPLWVVAGMCLSELIVHGEDLRRTLGTAPLEDQDAAYQAYLAGAALIPFVLTEWGRARQMTLGYRPARMQPIVVQLDRGTVFVAHHANTPVDVWFAGTPRHLLLTAYRRTGLVGGLRTIRMSGRRPYYALTAIRAFQAA
jgi:uncharacterized protein (TIGR03083 family)